MRITNQTDKKIAVVQGLNLSHATVSIKENTTIEAPQISKRAYEAKQVQVEAPVNREEVMQAAAMMREMLMADAHRSVKTQANINRRKAQILLEEE
jgi:CxxC motif-containing protein